jgi:LacI family transcriptional regulator
MATLYDVCEKTGLSTATVSRVINGSGLVKEETRQRVLQAIKELNYRPSHAARMLAGRKTDTIGVVLPLLDDGFYVQVLRGIDHVATRENLKLLISFYHSDADLSETLDSLYAEGRTDAIIVSNHTSLPPEKMRELTGEDIPIVLIAQNQGNIKAIDSVLIGNFQGAYSAVRHLLKKEPKSLLLLTGPDWIFDSRERLAGAQQAIKDAPCKPEVTILKGNFYQEEGRRVFAEHISRQGTFPDAVFALNDAMAFGVLDVLRDAGRQVPQETQVIGFDGTIMAQSFGLSSVSVPMREIGEEAVRLAVERVRNKDAKPVTMTLETRLTARKTTA